MNNSYRDPLRSDAARKPDTYCAGAEYKSGKWYALIADGWESQGVRRQPQWIPSGEENEQETLLFGESYVENLLRQRGLWTEDLGNGRTLSPLYSGGYDKTVTKSDGRANREKPNGSAAQGNIVPAANLSRVCVGIDNGTSGAIAVRFPGGKWQVHPSAVGQWNGRTVLDLRGNIQILEAIVAQAGGAHNVLVCFERARISKDFGIHVILQMGRHDEFWRVLLTLQRLRFRDVDPFTWQKFCWGPRGKRDTKVLALEYVQKHVPNCGWLQQYNQVQRTGIVDAMCIAIWTSETNAQPVP